MSGKTPKIKSEEKEWNARYEELLSFMDVSEDIHFSASSLAFLSEESKTAFYTQLNKLTLAFVASSEETQKAIGSDGIAAYEQVAKSLCEKTGFFGVVLPAALESYLENERQALAGSLRSAFMMCLQRKTSVLDSETIANSFLKERIAILEQRLFETWLAYALIDSLDPVEFREAVLSLNEELMPIPADNVYLGYQLSVKDLHLPEALFRTKSGAVYAYKFEKLDELFRYGVPALKNENSAMGTSESQLCHRIFLLYRIDDFDRVPILSNRAEGFALTPSLMVECLDPQSLPLQEALALACSRIYPFKDEASLCIVIKGTDQPPTQEKLSPSCTIHQGNFDPELLKPILAALINH
jgi:hypothetical protein